MTSSNTRSGAKLATLARASSPSTATATSNPLFSSEFERDDNIGFVIDDENLLGHAFVSLLFLRCRQRHRENEIRTLSRATFNPELTTEIFDDLPADGQSQPGTLGLSVRVFPP
jgi:hypothetical protein